jgi:ABC-2 type transport system ATP-binding protein
MAPPSSLSNQNAVEIKNVTKTFGPQVAVNDLSLTVPTGSIYGFIGPNGSGKTTTLRMIVRIYLPDKGSVSVLGQTIAGPANDKVAYLPEERGLYNQMKVRDILRFYARLKSYEPTEARMNDLLEKVGLLEHATKRVQQLSKGMSQKLQFIATIICKPTLVLLDEPFSGLDPVNAVVLKELIGQLRDEGATVIFSTHDMRVAEEMCDSIFMIHKGNKVLDGSLESIRAGHGQDVVHVRLAGGKKASRLASDHHGPIDPIDMTGYQEYRLPAGVDSQWVLQELTRQGSIESFQVARPSLQDIFVRIAAPDRAAMLTMG